jgi:protein-disulfide isomerase
VSSPYFAPPLPPPPPPPPPPGAPGAPRNKALLVAIGAGLAVVAVGAVVGALVFTGALDRRGGDDDHDDRPKSKVTKGDDKPKPKPPKLSTELPILEADPTRGARDATVTLVEFGDLEDSITASTEKTLEGLLTKYDKKLRVVWKDFPGTWHKNARRAAELARIEQLDGGLDRFWKRHDDALSHKGALASVLPEWEKALTKEAKEHYGEPASKLVDESAALGKKLNLMFTPLIFVDGEQVKIASKATLEKVVDAHAAEADALLAGGTAREDLYATLVTRHFVEPPPSSVGVQFDLDLTGATVWGSASAPATLEIFGDLDAHLYGDRISVVEQAKDADLRIVWRDHPTTPQGRAAAAVVRAIGTSAGAAQQQAAIDELWAAASGFKGKPLDDATLKSVAKAHGLGDADVEKAIKDSKLLSAIDEDLARADEADVGSSSTAFYVNGRRVYGTSKREVEGAIAWAIRVGKKRIDAGVPASDVYAKLVAGGTKRARRYVTLLPPKGAPTKGAAAGPGVVTVQLFFDFECPYSAKALAPGGPVDALLRAHPAEVQIVWRHLPAGYHKNAEPAAELALEAAAEKGTAAFFRVQDAVFKLKPLDAKGLEAVATAEGLDVAKARDAIATHKFKPVIDADATAARGAVIYSTPTFVFGDEVVTGTAVNVVSLEAALGRARRRAKP